MLVLAVLLDETAGVAFFSFLREAVVNFDARPVGDEKIVSDRPYGNRVVFGE